MASRRVRRVTKAYEKHLEKVMRVLILRVFQSVTVRSRVDTGFMRSRWSVFTGAAPTTSVDRPSDPTVASQQAVAFLEQNQSGAKAKSQTYVLSEGPVFIVNDARYAVFVNEGTPDPSSAMFVQMGIADGIAATRRALGG